jgi:dolichol-phosphate mannosyltransferase
MTDESAPRLAVVVPVFNEIVGIEECIRRVLDVLPGLEIPSLLVVVDDGSTDGTGDKLDALRSRLPEFALVHQANGGYGSALIAGAKEARDRGCNYVLFMDSDLTNPPEHIPRFIPAIVEGADLVKGNRFSRGGDMRAVAWGRRSLSVTANLISRPLFRINIADCTNGFRAIRTDLLLRMPLKERGFAIIMEELYWAKRWGAVVKSVPTSLTARSKEQRSTLFVLRPGLFWRYLKYALRAGVLQ